MRDAHLGPALAVLLILNSIPAALAGGGDVSNPPAAPSGGSSATQANPDINIPPAAKPTVGKPTVGTSDAVPQPAGTPAPTPTPPGADTSTAAPGGQAENTRNSALGTTGANVPNRHYGPKKPPDKHNPADGKPPGEGPS